MQLSIFLVSIVVAMAQKVSSEGEQTNSGSTGSFSAAIAPHLNYLKTAAAPTLTRVQSQILNRAAPAYAPLVEKHMNSILGTPPTMKVSSEGEQTNSGSTGSLSAAIAPHLNYLKTAAAPTLTRVKSQILNRTAPAYAPLVEKHMNSILDTPPSISSTMKDRIKQWKERAQASLRARRDGLQTRVNGIVSKDTRRPLSKSTSAPELEAAPPVATAAAE